jgi:putative methionine-R-sulfoxide reductase with GAF domain
MTKKADLKELQNRLQELRKKFEAMCLNSQTATALLWFRVKRLKWKGVLL